MGFKFLLGLKPFEAYQIIAGSLTLFALGYNLHITYNVAINQTKMHNHEVDKAAVQTEYEILFVQSHNRSRFETLLRNFARGDDKSRIDTVIAAVVRLYENNVPLPMTREEIAQILDPG